MYLRGDFTTAGILPGIGADFSISGLINDGTVFR
jgi:hypothetical protein